MNKMIIYEQPLNEAIRVCLRLEQLFRHIDHHQDDTSEISVRNTIALIINILHLLDRSDLKAKLTKELQLFQHNLLRYSDAPELDTAKCQGFIQKLEE